MKTIFGIFILLLSTYVIAEPVFVGDTKVTFVPPAGFKELPQEIIDTKWRSKDAPKFVVGNDRATTTVAYDLKNHDISKASLSEIKDSFGELFERIIPGIQWIKREIIEHSGKDWILLEMSSHAIDTDIHNIMFLTSYEDKMLVFNFNSTKDDFKGYEKQLRESLLSIKLPQ